MRTFYFEANGHHFEFVCTSRDTRNGFAHDTTLICNGGDWDNLSATCFYYNRTWERYCYQTVMQRVVGDEIERCIEAEREDFMEERGYKRLTAARKQEFMEHIDANPGEALKTYCELYELVENYDLMEPPYPDWYGSRPRSFKPSYFA